MKRQTDLRWFDPTHEFQVGETVMMVSANGRDREVVVSKVGRKLLYVQVYGRDHAFRMDNPFSRPANDDYQHESILTLQEVEYRDLVVDTIAVLKEAGVEVARPQTWPIERLEAILSAATAVLFPGGDGGIPAVPAGAWKVQVPYEGDLS